VFGPGHYLPPPMIQPFSCDTVLIGGVTVVNSPIWHLNPNLCRNGTVAGLSIASTGHNTDGCDPESCDGVVIDGVTFSTGDDCVAIKAGRDTDGRRVNVPCQNVVIQRCGFASGHGGITVGSEMTGGVSGVYARDLTMNSTSLAAGHRVKTNSLRGGYVRDTHRPGRHRHAGGHHGHQRRRAELRPVHHQPGDRRRDDQRRAGHRVGLAAVTAILITGAAGQIGTMLRPRLARPSRTLRLLDIAALAAGPAEEVIQASATDMAAMTSACRGVDAVIHLAGISGEAGWDEIAEQNIHGTYVAFEAARRAGVPRVIFASSNHAVGFTPRSAFPVPDCAFPAPDTYYGVAKVAGEALAALYHHRYGLDTICIRILTCFETPPSARALSTWLSPDDAGRLFEACLSAASPGFRVVYGVSANTRGGWVSLAGAAALGYTPADDAEVYAAEVIAEHGEPDPDSPVFRYLGGEFTLPDLDAEIPAGG
jgi:uronate dehydrogenase